VAQARLVSPAAATCVNSQIVEPALLDWPVTSKYKTTVQSIHTVQTGMLIPMPAWSYVGLQLLAYSVESLLCRSESMEKAGSAHEKVCLNIRTLDALQVLSKCPVTHGAVNVHAYTMAGM
jgi:hypothetical protein